MERLNKYEEEMLRLIRRNPDEVVDFERIRELVEKGANPHVYYDLPLAYICKRLDKKLFRKFYTEYGGNLSNMIPKKEYDEIRETYSYSLQLFYGCSVIEYSICNDVDNDEMSKYDFIIWVIKKFKIDIDQQVINKLYVYCLDMYNSSDERVQYLQKLSNMQENPLSTDNKMFCLLHNTFLDDESFIDTEKIKYLFDNGLILSIYTANRLKYQLLATSYNYKRPLKEIFELFHLELSVDDKEYIAERAAEDMLNGNLYLYRYFTEINEKYSERNENNE